MAKRKVVGIVVGLDFGQLLRPDSKAVHISQQAIYVACDDGAIFYLPFGHKGWEEFPLPVPGTEAAEECGENAR